MDLQSRVELKTIPAMQIAALVAIYQRLKKEIKVTAEEAGQVSPMEFLDKLSLLSLNYDLEKSRRMFSLRLSRKLK